ncbi:hypothetical protein Dsin_005906 [Dipteronia sinensis]|uniref:Reverse transcriptase domain-containing protein n=1 Tax=Dipteronia sinensis TaxID=43782 RepID=A0AAE0EFC3_9ROSI|nr:hypothetical protein Dsin_005906 [Dipteronia sinensis]
MLFSLFFISTKSSASAIAFFGEETIVNGHSGGKEDHVHLIFVRKEALNDKQGDPLSPYLFLFCAEGLSCLVNQAVRNKEITGFKCSSTGPIISHLLFADDSLLFAEAAPSNCVSIRRILDFYAKASGQEVNYTKSAMCVSPSLKSQASAHLTAIVGVREAECHEKYLGLPCFTGRHKQKVFTDISKRVWDKIKG